MMRRNSGASMHLFNKLKHEKAFLFSLSCQSNVCFVVTMAAGAANVRTHDRDRHWLGINNLGLINS